MKAAKLMKGGGGDDLGGKESKCQGPEAEAKLRAGTVQADPQDGH